jgi:hypothetical protein
MHLVFAFGRLCGARRRRWVASCRPRRGCRRPCGARRRSWVAASSCCLSSSALRCLPVGRVALGVGLGEAAVVGLVLPVVVGLVLLARRRPCGARRRPFGARRRPWSSCYRRPWSSCCRLGAAVVVGSSASAWQMSAGDDAGGRPTAGSRPRQAHDALPALQTSHLARVTSIAFEASTALQTSNRGDRLADPRSRRPLPRPRARFSRAGPVASTTGQPTYGRDQPMRSRGRRFVRDDGDLVHCRHRDRAAPPRSRRDQGLGCGRHPSAVTVRCPLDANTHCVDPWRCRRLATPNADADDPPRLARHPMVRLARASCLCSGVRPPAGLGVPYDRCRGRVARVRGLLGELPHSRLDGGIEPQPGSGALGVRVDGGRLGSSGSQRAAPKVPLAVETLEVSQCTPQCRRSGVRSEQHHHRALCRRSRGARKREVDRG